MHTITQQPRWWRRLATCVLVLYWGLLLLGTHLPNYAVGPAQYNDKVAHFLGYAGLAFLLSWVWSTRRPLVPWGVLVVPAVTILYGALDELTQIPVPGRSGEWADWRADILGSALGVAAFWCLELIYRRLSRVEQREA